MDVSALIACLMATDCQAVRIDRLRPLEHYVITTAEIIQHRLMKGCQWERFAHSYELSLA
jgi:hypothetical protein